MEFKDNPPWIKILIKKFPYTYDETGACEMLDENNLCKVYINRPALCNTDKTLKRFPFLAAIPERDFIEMNEKTCNQLRLLQNSREKHKSKIPA